MLDYLKKNKPYIFILLIGIGVAWYKSNFIIAVSVFSGVILLGLIVGYIINKLIK
jgi:hypothetical protein